jgi:hypothetical protein
MPATVTTALGLGLADDVLWRLIAYQAPVSMPVPLVSRPRGKSAIERYRLTILRIIGGAIGNWLSPGRAAPLSVMARDFADKSAARQWVWDRLVAEGVARWNLAL